MEKGEVPLSETVLYKKDRGRFLLEIITPGNLQRMFWLIVVCWPLSIGFAVLNVFVGQEYQLLPWSFFDIGGSLIFFVSYLVLRRKKRLGASAQYVVLGYYLYLLVSMGGYYFPVRETVGETSTYVLGLVMAGVLFHLPPVQFLTILLGSQAIFVTLVLNSNCSFDQNVAALVSSTNGVIVAAIASWFFYRREWENFRKGEEHSQINQKLEAANVRLRESNEEMNEVMAIAAHDLRSPLCSVQSFFDVFRTDEDWKKEPYASVLRELAQISGGMLSLIDRLLVAHASEEEISEIRMQNVDVSELIRRCVRKLQRTAETKNISIKIENLSPLTVQTDSSMLMQIVDNLLSNALKFVPRDTIITIAAGQIQGDCWLEIRDEGPGIAEEDRDKIFRKFYRGKNRPTGNEPRTGLGLFIVRKLVESLKGSVVLRQNVPHGAIFRVTLPMQVQSLPSTKV